MLFVDQLLVDRASVRKTDAGYLVTEARFARTGIQHYRADELGDDFADLPGDQMVPIYRAPEEVFSKDSLRSWAYVPMTNNHPRHLVDAKSWKKDATGNAGGEILRDGEFVKIPLILMDAQAIADYEAGRDQLSGGYMADTVRGDGITDKGESFMGRQTNIRGNHIAQCDAARGGADLKIPRIGDSNPNPEPTMPKTILVDGLSVEVTDAAELAIGKLQRDAADLRTQLTDAQGQVGTLTAAVATKDGEITGLKAQLADTALTPAKLDAAVRARSALIGDAKRIVSDFNPGVLSDGEIRRAVVAKKLGDAVAATLTSDEAINGCFAGLLAGAPKSTVRDSVREAVLQDGEAVHTDADQAVADARAEMIANITGTAKAA